jgi:ZIP family zinc transporter
MGRTWVFALAASGALLFGGILGAYWQAPKGLIATALPFASGALVSALAFELYEEAFSSGGVVPAAGGFLAGAATFVIIDALLERLTKKLGDGATGFALLAGVTLDGVPENLALGITLIGGGAGGGGIALLAAIFASNLPEALGGAIDMREQGHSRRFAIGIWAFAAVLLGAAVILGSTLLGGLSEAKRATLLAFAGGAVLASLADTLMPKAYKDGGPFVAFATAAGFLTAFLLSEG